MKKIISAQPPNPPPRLILEPPCLSLFFGFLAFWDSHYVFCIDLRKSSKFIEKYFLAKTETLTTFLFVFIL